MIINAGTRRLVSYRFGWKIEIEAKNEKTGEKYWKEDRPAYPATLAQACQMLCERELADRPDITIDQLPQALRQAAHKVREYMTLARNAA